MRARSVPSSVVNLATSFCSSSAYWCFRSVAASRDSLSSCHAASSVCCSTCRRLFKDSSSSMRSHRCSSDCPENLSVRSSRGVWLVSSGSSVPDFSSVLCLSSEICSSTVSSSVTGAFLVSSGCLVSRDSSAASSCTACIEIFHRLLVGSRSPSSSFVSTISRMRR
jgi:hypothetical protein